jgi:hypothetical protein
MSDKDDKPVNPFQKMFNRMLGTFAEHQWERLLKSYFLQMRPERTARLDTVIELSVELEAVRKQSIFATGFGRSAIEAVIEGDWKSAREHVDWLSFREEGPDIQAKYGPLWERFRATLLAATAAAEARAKEDPLKEASGGN